MTQEEHNILIENNIMLKQILAYIRQRDGPKDDIKDFIMNVIANIVSNNIDNIK